MERLESKYCIAFCKIALKLRYLKMWYLSGHVSEDQLKSMYENSRPSGSNNTFIGKIGLLDALNHSEVSHVQIQLFSILCGAVLQWSFI